MTFVPAPQDCSFTWRQASVWFRRIPPDETLYSALARFHGASGYNRPESTSLVLIGHPGGAGMTDTPAGLGLLEQATGGAIRATEATLRKRSVLGPYLGLMQGDRRASTLQDCKTSDLAKASIGAGLVFNHVAPRHPLKLCMKCCDEQRRRIGFAYWRTRDQWPGRWLCRRHGLALRYAPSHKGRPGCWRTVDWCIQSGSLRQIQVPDGNLRHLIARIGMAVDWLAGRETISPDLLQIAVRERLVDGGILRNEVSCSRTEYMAIHERLTTPLAATGIPDFIGFRDGRWVRQVLIDRRYAHPLRWAVLLAAHGAVDRAGLDRAYRHAAERCPQPPLFDSDPTHRRACAPPQIYEALTGPVTLNAAAASTGVRKTELQLWLRRDAELAAHRRRTGDEIRLRAAVFTIEGYCRENPRAFRSEVIRGCLWAVRWLEVHDPVQLETLLPAVVPMFDRQLRLDFGGETRSFGSRAKYPYKRQGSEPAP